MGPRIWCNKVCKWSTIYRNCFIREIVKFWIKKCLLTYFVALTIQSEENSPKNGKPTVDFSFITMLRRTGQFCSRILSKEQCNNTGVSSPDLGPADFQLLPRLQSALKRRRFCSCTDIIKNATEELKSLSQTGMQECFQHLHSRWQTCIVAQRDYLEGHVA